MCTSHLLAMATVNKKKQEEKHLRMMRALVALPSNKSCFDCNQRGPTYVNMTIGSFVCTSCSGILRGLNPPHRVKSISMASFTQEEMNILSAQGNEFNRMVYLRLHDTNSWPEPDSRDDQLIHEFMVQKYENKRFFVEPTDVMRQDARRLSENVFNAQLQPKHPLRSTLGGNALRLTNQGSQKISSPTSNTQPSTSLPNKISTPLTTVAQVIRHPAKPAFSSFDLLGDLGADPFSSSVSSTTASNNTEGFADFSNFGTTQSVNHTRHNGSSAYPLFTKASLMPLDPARFGDFTAQPSSAALINTPSANFSAISDKYSALADLDSAFNSVSLAPQSVRTVNWSSSASGFSGPGSSVGGSAFGWSSGVENGSLWDGGNAAINWGNAASPVDAVSGGMLGAAGGGNGLEVGGGGNVFAPATPSVFPGNANHFGATWNTNVFETQYPMAVGEKGGHAFAAGVGSMPPQHHPLQNGIFGAVAASGTLPPANMAPGAFYGLPQQQAFSGVVAQQSPHGSLGLPVPQQRLAWNQMSGGAPFGLQGASSNPFLLPQMPEDGPRSARAAGGRRTKWPGVLQSVVHNNNNQQMLPTPLSKPTNPFL